MAICPQKLEKFPAEKLAMLEAEKHEARIRLEKKEEHERLKREKIIEEAQKREAERIANPAMEKAFPVCEPKVFEGRPKFKTYDIEEFQPEYCNLEKKDPISPDPRHADGICLPFRGTFDIIDPCDPECKVFRKPEIKTSDFYHTINLPLRFEYPGCFKNYGETRQPSLHPFYMTTSSIYGYISPSVHTVPTRYYPKSSTFSNYLSKTKSFKTGSLNTSLDPIYDVHIYTR